MEKPKSITQLNKEQLEDMCLNLLHVNKVKHDEWDKATDELLKERMKTDKAIEFIKDACLYPCVDSHIDGEVYSSMTSDEVKELLEILGGK